MPSIRVKEREPFDIALRRFKRSCESAGVVTEVRKESTMKSQLVSVKGKNKLLLKEPIKAI